MAACCAIGALVIYKLMSIYSHLPQLRSATLEKDEAQPKNDEGLNVDQKSDAGPQTCRFSLHGLTCMSCVSAVEKSLRAAPGVQEVSVSLHALTAFVTFDATQISPRELQSAVENTGFAAQLSGNEDDWKSQWTTAATSRQRSIQEWQDAFNKSVLAGLLVFSLDTLSPWIDRPSLVTAFGVIANAVTAVSILWLAGAIHREALAALRHGRLDTSTLSSAGLLCVLASASLQELLGQSEGRGTVPLTSACMLLTLTIGVKLIKCAVSKRSSQLPTLLASALPDTASLLLATNGGRIKQAVPLHLIQPGDLVHIETGASFPGDCVIVEGEASVLQTIVNGELDPVNVKVGESVHAGSTNCGCAVIGNVLRVGKDTWLGNTLNAISRANREKSSLESFSDRFLDWFGTVVLALAVASAILQLKDKASLLAVLNKTASILLCACPCTMGMGIPVCLMAAIREYFHILGFKAADIEQEMLMMLE
jgi:Cu+-exporting ATPase